MRFSLFSEAVLVGLAAVGCAAQDCDTGPFAPFTVAGPAFPSGPDPETNCDTRWSTGEVIVGIEAWSAKFQVKAVRFKFSQSGWTPVRGTLPKVIQAHETKEWDASDEVAIRLWSNKPDDGKPMDAVGRIIITKDGNKIFEVGGNSGKVGKELVVDNGAGLVLAAKTRSGAWLSSIQFSTLKSTVVATEIVDLQIAQNLDAWNKQQEGIENVNIASVYYVNRNDVGGPNLTYTFTNTDSREEKKSITSQRSNQWTVGTKLTVGGEVGIPLLVKGSVSTETSVQYQNTKMDGTETSITTKKDLSFALGAPATSSFLQPQRAAHCEAWAVTGRFESAYTGIIKATLADGSTYTYSDAGDVTSVGWERANTSCEDIDIKDVPSEAAVVPATTAKRAIEFRG